MKFIRPAVLNESLFGGKGRGYVSKIVLFNDPVPPGSELPREYTEVLDQLGAKDLHPLPLVNGVACSFPETRVQAISDFQHVFSVEEDLIVRLQPVMQEERLALMKNDDQIIPTGVARIGAPEVWSKWKGAGVKVAVLDTGIDMEHTDLAANYRGGINLISPGRPPQDDNGHGTHIAGTIGAVDDGKGIIGIAPEVELYAVKALNSRGEGTISSIVQALQWCVENGMHIVNMSIGTDTPSTAMAQAVRQAASHGIVLVAAAGNDGTRNSVDYPAAYPETIAVGAIGDGNDLAPFSSRGPEVTVVAPGMQVLSTGLHGNYRRLSGTSMATPHVTGTVAIMLQAVSGLNHSSVVKLLQSSAEKLPNLESDQQGAGLVRVDRAIGMGATPSRPKPSPWTWPQPRPEKFFDWLFGPWPGKPSGHGR